MMTRNDAVAMQLFCVMMTFSDALPVLSTKNDGHCHHSRMGVFPDWVKDRQRQKHTLLQTTPLR